MTAPEDRFASHHDVSSGSSPDSCNHSFVPLLVNDFDLPITVKKGVRSSAKYSMPNVVYYYSLSPSFRRFAIGLSSVSVPRCVADALSQL